MNSKSLLSLFALSFALLFFSSCEDENKTGCTDPLAINFDADAETADNTTCTYPELMLHMHFKVNGDDLVYDQMYTINGVNTKFSLAQFYLSNFSLLSSDGTEKVIEDSYLLVKPEQMMYSLGAVDNNTYTQLKYNFGIDATTNSQSEEDFAARPLDDPLGIQNPSMTWNWNVGYVFAKFEGFVDATGDGITGTEMRFHIGTDDLYRSIETAIDVSANAASNTVHLDIELSKVFETIDLAQSNFTMTVSGLPETDFAGLASTVADNMPNVFSVQ